jgi:hypothetical protein
MPTLETSDTACCLTLAAPEFEESLRLQADPVDYPLGSDLTERLDSVITESTSSAGEDWSSFSAPDPTDSGEPHEDHSDAVQPGGELSSPCSDALIQACDHTLCETPASASAFPSVSAPLPVTSEPIDAAGVQMLCVSDSAACPTPSPIMTSACSHSHSFGRAVHEKATEHRSPTVLPQRSLRRALALESPLAGDRVTPAPPKRGGSQLLSILAVIGGLLTLAALAYVASDLASWFGSP